MSIRASEFEIARFAAAEAAVRGVLENPEPAKSYKIPEIQYLVFGPAAQEIYRAVHGLLEWLAIPYVKGKDGLGLDHDAWSAWRERFKHEYGIDAYENVLRPWLNNKYRGNILAQPRIFIEELQRTLEKGPSEQRRMARRIDRMFPVKEQDAMAQEYRTLPFEQRRPFIEKLESKIVKLLKFLAESANEVAGSATEREAA